MTDSLLVLMLLVGAWALLTVDLSPANLVLGVALAGLCLIVLRRASGRPTGTRRLVAISTYVLHLVVDLVVSSLRLAWDVVTPRHRSRPRVVEIPVRVRSEAALTALASSITLTPGTLTIEAVSGPTPRLLVHFLYAASDEEATATVRLLERRLLECLPAASRPVGPFGVVS